MQFYIHVFYDNLRINLIFKKISYKWKYFLMVLLSYIKKCSYNKFRFKPRIWTEKLTKTIDLQKNKVSGALP